MDRRLAEVIKRMRQESNLTQMELAEKLGTSQGYIATLENARCNVSMKIMARIAEELGYTLTVECVKY
jgi:transcriptional regulator with XRE-family HTH domain